MVSRVSAVVTTIYALLFVPSSVLGIDLERSQSSTTNRASTGTDSRAQSALQNDAFRLEIQEGVERSTMNVRYQPGTALSLRARYLESRPKGATPLHDSDPVGAWNVRMNYSPEAQPITIQGEADFSRLDAASGTGFFTRDNHNLSIGFSAATQDLGSFGKLSYGSSLGIRGSNHQWAANANDAHQAAGFVSLAPGKYGGRLWGAWKAGYFKLLGSVTSADDYPARSSTGTSSSETRASLNLDAKLPAWPRIGLSTRLYQGIRRIQPLSAYDDAGNERTAGLDHKVTLDLDSLKATLSSKTTRAGAFNATRSHPTLEQRHSFGASYRPLEALSIKSSLGISRFKYAQLGTESRERHASLSIAYKPPHREMNFSMYGSYASQQRPEWSEDAHRFKLGSSFARQLKGHGFEPNSLSLRANYDRYFDPLAGRGSRDDFSLWLVLKVGADRPSRSFGLGDTP